MNKNDSALSLDAQVYLHDIEKADILVGIPSFNNVLTASYVISQVTKGLDTYFPNFKSVIFVSDGNSKDETLTSVKKLYLPSEVKLIPAIYMGISGKGRAAKRGRSVRTGTDGTGNTDNRGARRLRAFTAPQGR